MVALVTRGTDGAPLAIHRTFLARDGTSKAPIEPAKMMLGPCRGGAVRLGPIGDRLMVAEGIRNCALGHAGDRTSGMGRTLGLRAARARIAGGGRDVVVLADGDEPGEAAAHDAARRWKRGGWRVRIARPPRGFDVSDVLLDRTFGHVEGAARPPKPRTRSSTRSRAPGNSRSAYRRDTGPKAAAADRGLQP